MSKKILFLFVSLSLIASLLLGACQAQNVTNEPAEEPETPAETEEAEEPEEAEEGEEPGDTDDVITIEYWQYFFEPRVDAMNYLIEQFEAENPGIEVIHNSDIPYGEFIDKVAASASAGTGPDVVTLYYGWIPNWVDAGYLVPLPEEEFSEQWIEDNFLPMVTQSKFLDEYWALPTAVRTLALLWNKDLFEQAGLDPEVPPQTLEELVTFAQATTVGEDPEFEVMGFAPEVPGQAHHWFREILVRQFGGQPYSEDGKTVLWNSPEGCEAFQYMAAFETEYGTGSNDYFDGSTQAFLNGKLAIHIDGSFRLGTIAANAPDLNFGVAELPTMDGVKSTFGSYWTHGITNKAASDPAKMEAAIKFLKFISSADAGLYWAQNVGELPAQLAAADNEELLSDPHLGPFVAGLTYANATFFVDEKAQREVIVGAYDELRLMGGDPCEILDYYAEQEQEVLDEFWANH
jgi:multiple sugar transport system substrate-binding protein